MADKIPNRTKLFVKHKVDGPHVLSKPKRDNVGLKLAKALRPKKGKAGLAAASNSNTASGFGTQNPVMGYGSSGS